MRDPIRRRGILAAATLAAFLVSALPAQSEGTTVWSFLTSGPVGGIPAIATDGTLYVGNEATVASQSRLYAIRPDGSLRWQFAGATDWITAAPAVGADGTVYVGSWDGRLYALNPATGAVRWTYSTVGFIASSAAVGADGTIYVGSGDRSLHAINPDGTPRWSYPVTDWIDSSPAIAGDGTVYFGSYDNNVYALTSAGALRWQFNAGDNVTSSPAIGTDGTVYVGCANGKLFALNGATGARRWEYATGAGIAGSPAIGSGGIVYVGSLDGYLYAVDATNGALAWRTALGGEIYSTPAIRADGTVVVGGGVYLHALNPDGTQRWRLTAGDFVDSSPLIAPDGTIYVGSMDRRFYAVSGNGQSLAAGAPWPTFHRSNDRVGRTTASPASGGAGTPPVIDSMLGSQVATAGNTVSLTVGASGTAPLSYQWRRDGVALAGATGATLTLPSVGSGDAGNYTVVVSNAAGSTTSAALALTVNSVVIPQPAGVAVDGSGNLYVSDASTNVVHRVTASGVVSALAGGAGSAGSTDGTGAAARFNQPRGLHVGSSGSIVTVADSANSTVRSITDGVVATLAGSPGTRGNADGAGSAASFNGPQAVAFGGGAFFVADSANHTVRRIAGTPAVVSTVAGAAGQSGSADGTGGGARFNTPSGVAVATDGTVYIADTTNNTIRRLVAGSGAVTTFAGLAGVSGSSDGSGSGALFNRPTGLAVDATGNVFVADTGNSTIRRITPAGAVGTFAGLPGIAGLQDGAGTRAYFNQPQAVAVDASGNLFVADTGNATLRRISTGGVVTTLSLTAAAPPPPSPPPPAPVPTPTPAPSGGGGGGGGGGAATPAALLALAAALAARRRMRG